MSCRSQTTAFLVLFGVILGCSGHDPLEGAGSAAFAQELPAECADFELEVPPDSIRLGVPFPASVKSQQQNVAYEWDGEGVHIETDSGSHATLHCAWPGWHMVSVSACGATQTAQVECVPATCSGYADIEQCPGFALAESATECPKTNVIVRYPKFPECPAEIRGARGSWVGGRLLDAPYSAGDPRPQFCAYHWSAPPTAIPDTRVLPRDSRDWQWDCPKVAAHGDYAEMNAALAAHGQSNLGRIEWTAPELGSVRVAVIDTAANEWRDADNSPHGKAVGTLILDTACTEPATCRVRVENYLGLPLLRDAAVIRRDLAHGGSFGARSDLARAILEAVDATPTGHLVLNLSVAYDLDPADTLLPTSLPREGDFANRVVLEALRYARCHGALILAAAGNGRVPAHPDQAPGLPARWTRLRGPDANLCARFGIAHSSDDVPLLYAVSAVDFGANPLMTTRGRGQSVLAALGFAVVRQDPNGGYTRTLTGTSMSAAAFAGIAASLWSHVPSLSPDEVVRDLYDVSPPISAAPDFKPYSPPLAPDFFVEPRRITRCSIADTSHGVAICTDRPDAVPTVPDSVVPDLPSDALEEEQLPLAEPDRGVSPWDFPWIRPQPEGEPGCTSCSLKLRRHRLDLVLRSSFKPAGNLHLVVRSGASGIASFTQEKAFEEETGTTIACFEAETVPFFVLLNEEDLGTPTAAELAYQVAVDGVNVDTTEPVLIEPDDIVVEEF
jgi:hypothetical protein